MRSVHSAYHQIAGKSLSRLGSLSDGVFSIAMTLMVLDVRAPAADAIRAEADLLRALWLLLPSLGMYALSFLTLGIFWIGQQTQLDFLERSNRSLAWIHIVFLFGVSFTPFSTGLLAQFASYRTALLAYWFNIFFLGVMLSWSWRHALHSGLVKSDVSEEVSTAIRRRIAVGQVFYAAGAGLCFVHPYWSLAVFLAVQITYAIGFNRGSSTR